jgi:hypothetical protein
VPSKGLEPPHPCGYMDLNHARLPIPPRWQKVLRGGRPGPPSRKKPQINILQGHYWLSNQGRLDATTEVLFPVAATPEPASKL